jgi:hypothetical protein
MKTETKYQGASLTLFSIERTEILGELSDAAWVEESSSAGINYVLSGSASEGTLDTILQIIQLGVAWVAYDFETGGHMFQGQAMLLRPNVSGPATVIRVETPDEPQAADKAGVSSTTGSA